MSQQASAIETPKSMVVGVDYSDTGERALHHAFTLAAGDGESRVHVVSVCLGSRPRVRLNLPEETKSVTVDEATEHLVLYVRRQLEAFRTSGAVLADDQVVTHLRVGAPAKELCEVGGEQDADLILVGTHGRKGISRLLLGSVAEAVASEAHCPVFVVKS